MHCGINKLKYTSFVKFVDLLEYPVLLLDLQTLFHNSQIVNALEMFYLCHSSNNIQFISYSTKLHARLRLETLSFRFERDLNTVVLELLGGLVFRSGPNLHQVLLKDKVFVL